MVKILAWTYPGLIVLSLTLTCSPSAASLVQERELKLRYLLNFTGIDSVAYILGNFLADIVIFMLPSAIFTVIALILKIDGFYQVGLKLFLTLTAFSLGFMALNYCTSFIYSSHETAFKHQVKLLLFIQVVLPFLIYQVVLFLG